MEFWGVKVLPSKSIKCPVEDSSYLHISNAALGEVGSSAKNERVILRLKTQGEEIVLGTLIPGQRDHIALDLIISKSFQLSHNSSTLAVHFSGYRTEGSGELQELDREHDRGVRKENDGKEESSGSSYATGSKEDQNAIRENANSTKVRLAGNITAAYVRGKRVQRNFANEAALTQHNTAKHK
ncbi:hypothetical protein SELMODRAFT_428242 [Selaginella moellendorffii]|uniref:Nucleoplasmin-like domain-containing protein n=1 Tax=Selaginella moellendorffii TaxID=88036 RepID=D8T272_SELML|nr:hypothetical protein SELMODRAFT_428242 [Selaginella moellendorffii]